MKYLLVTLGNPNISPNDLGFHGATLFADSPSNPVWRLEFGWNDLPRLGELLISQKIRSAYASDKPLPKDRLWMASEWGGSLVADRSVATALRDFLGGWATTVWDGDDLVIFTPVTQDQAVKYHAMLENPEPRFIIASREKVLKNPQVWFGEYSDDRYGGWTTLISAARPDREGFLTLGNLAALGLKRDENPSSAWAVQRSGAIRLHAVGLERSQLEMDRWHTNGGFKIKRDNFRFVDDVSRIRSNYLIALQIEAPIDPTVIIGSGVVFEQVQPLTSQNLAVVEPWETTIDAGQILGLLMPAWCINHHLHAPSGQPLRATPLSFVGDRSSQQAVWADIARRQPAGNG
jgi:hypothetical protein